jgi:hypothetical protein
MKDPNKKPPVASFTGVATTLGVVHAPTVSDPAREARTISVSNLVIHLPYLWNQSEGSIGWDGGANAA